MGRGPWYTNAIHDANGKFDAGATKIVELYLTLVIAGLGAKLTGRLAAWLEPVR
jgi:cyanate permease